MTNEERAARELAAKVGRANENDCVSAIAQALEASRAAGRAERDGEMERLKNALAIVDRRFADRKIRLEAAEAKVAELEPLRFVHARSIAERLAQARHEGIEEAVTEACDKRHLNMVGGSTGNALGTQIAIVKAIRALLPSEPSSGGK